MVSIMFRYAPFISTRAAQPEVSVSGTSISCENGLENSAVTG